MDDQFIAGSIKAILEKYADPIIESIGKKAKDEWEKFKVDFDFAFIKYLKNTYQKYSKIKTILYKTEPQFIYDFFEVPYLKKGSDEVIKAESVNNITDISNFIIIQGIGGIGKSTLMKHFFIDELSNKDLIPVYIELKDVNDLNDEYSLSDLFYEKLNNLGSSLSKEYFTYALRSGCFLFLVDGYDEILSEKRNGFFKKFDAFCDSYSQNYFIVSSRPYSEFIELQRFTVLSTCPFEKKQALSLINKLNYDIDIKKRFMIALDQELYEKHESFASNPLLLSIMLLTFDNYAEIPSKLHLFYANAFETLFEKHDATKAGFRRELRSGLSFDEFKKVFSYFCVITYVQGKIEFSRDELIDTFRKISIKDISIDIESYIYDLINSLCVLYRDGIYYRFTHRSFQEYFTAFFLKELSDSNMTKMGVNIIKKDMHRVSHDSVFYMLKDMTEERFETNIILPLLIEFEKDLSEEKYDFYFKKIIKGICFRRVRNSDLELVMTLKPDDIAHVIVRLMNPYKQHGSKSQKLIEAEKSLLNYLESGVENLGKEKHVEINCEMILKDPILFQLVKSTWIGEDILYYSTLKASIEIKQQSIAVELTNLLQ